MNRLLSSLPQEDRAALTRVTRSVRVVQSQVLRRQGTTYFPISAVLSIRMALKNGSATEIAMIGPEGCLGAELPSATMLVARAGEVETVETAEMLALAARSGAIRLALSASVESLLHQAAVTSACGKAHSVRQQLCRWILSMSDRAEPVEATQDWIAQALGVARPTINEAARYLMRQKVITAERSEIRILHRDRLERAACECYRMLRAPTTG